MSGRALRMGSPVQALAGAGSRGPGPSPVREQTDRPPLLRDRPASLGMSG